MAYRRSEFSSRLSAILGRLRTAGITQSELVSRTIPLCDTEPAFSRTTLSMWKHGRTNPTLAKLRALVTALERCHYGANRPLVTPEEIGRLVSAAGFTLDEMAAMTHDIASRTNGSIPRSSH